MRRERILLPLAFGVAVALCAAIAIYGNWTSSREQQAYDLIEADQGRVLPSDRKNVLYSVRTDAGIDVYAMDKTSHAKRLLYAHADRIEGSDDGVHFVWDMNERWLLLSIGTYAGVEPAYTGGIYRIDKAGGEAAMLTDRAELNFWVIDDWLYANCAESRRGEIAHASTGESFRVHVGDGTVEDTGDRYPYIVGCIGQKITYTGFGVTSDKMLRVYDLAAQTDTPLFDPSDVQRRFAGEPGYSHVRYGFVTMDDEAIRFTVMVHGFQEGDPAGGHIMHEEAYRVRLDGTGLEAIE